jgi:glutamate-1-semialdehyde 2,1-aminomutase
LTSAVAGRIRAIAGAGENEGIDFYGIGGTLAGNALSTAAMRVTLQHVLTQEAYDRMMPLARRFTSDVQTVIEEHQLPWHVTRLGCRAEYWFQQTPPRNGAEASASEDTELARYMHLAALNRGVMLTPFHNMALMSPDTSEADVEFHTQVFRESVEALVV